jgi:hypothetical protein
MLKLWSSAPLPTLGNQGGEKPLMYRDMLWLGVLNRGRISNVTTGREKPISPVSQVVQYSTHGLITDPHVAQNC